MTTISNPPYNMKWKHPFFTQSQPRFDLGVPPESNANYAFILTALEETNSAVFLLPNGVLSTNNKNEVAIKKRLIDKNYLEAVVMLPNKMFEATSIPTCLMIFDKNKQHSTIQMIDISDKGVKKIRKQRGQFGSEANVSRVYEKEVNVLTDELINEVLEMVFDKKNIEGVSKTASIADVKNQDYILTPSRYFDTKEIIIENRKYEDIISDLNRIIDYKNSVKITINENMAKSLGIYDLALSMKKGQETQKNMNKMLSLINLKIKKEDSMALSRYKEFKFEVKDFEKLPEIISLFINMWRQHMLMLNNEENRLLVELRDALLPDLISGKISLSEGETE